MAMREDIQDVTRMTKYSQYMKTFYDAISIVKKVGFCILRLILWWAMRDSNARPLVPETNALSS